MNPWLDDGDVKLYAGEALATLREMPSESVQMIMTSPPFWGLRSYIADDHADKPLEIGLEETPDEWCTRLVAVMREARRVLRSDGVCWIEVGDTYASDSKGGGGSSAFSTLVGTPAEDNGQRFAARRAHHGVKQKDLVGAPWLLAFALRADGWCLRSDCIWSRPNPMPESVTDRPTKAHSYLFLMTKATWVGADQPMPMRDVDAAWLAALIDGEGSICFQERERADGGPNVGIRLSIVNTNRALLERVTEITDMADSPMPSPRPRNDGNPGRPIFTWQVTNAKAARVIAAVRPYLIAKRTQADLALYVHELNQGHRGRGGHVTKPADLASKRRAAAACSDLNRGVPVDLSWFKAPKPGRWVPNAYSYDADAIREEHTGDDSKRNKPGYELQRGTYVGGGINDGRTRPNKATLAANGRNARSVWSIPTEPTPFAHFATFPQALVERCIKAGTSEHGACSVCGAPWRRITDVTHSEPNYVSGKNVHNADRNDKGRTMFVGGGSQTLGWEPSCAHDAPVVPCKVLDCFVGSGTTALVARRLGRHAIGIELNAEYLKIAAGRLQQPTLWSQPVEQA